MKQYAWSILAIVLAFALNSFTTAPLTPKSSLVWFDVNSGVPETTGGILSENPPSGCESDEEDLCARGFAMEDVIAESESNPTTYSLKPQVDPEEDWADESYRE